jgi:hypothetical protein
MQEASTGKKRVDKLDWMYAAPSQEGGALGGARIGDREMEEYLLGKRRVDEVLAQGDKNVSGSVLFAGSVCWVFTCSGLVGNGDVRRGRIFS